MIQRRDYLFGAAAYALGLPRAGAARGPGRIHRVGVLRSADQGLDRSWEEFVTELSRRGYVEGSNLVFESRRGEEFQPDRVHRLAAELAASNVELIYTHMGTLGALAAKRATQSIPVVFHGASDPVSSGLVASLSHPGGNLTGNASSIFDSFPKSLQFLAEAIGRNNIRIVEIYPVDARHTLPWFSKMDAAIAAVVAALGAKFEYAEVASVAEIEPLVKRLARERADAAILGNFPMSVAQRQWVAALFVEHRLASVGDPRDGFLLQYLPSSRQLSRKAAEYVDKILKGAKPSELPVEQVSIFELAINLKTAKAIGLRIPQSLLLRAEEVVQ